MNKIYVPVLGESVSEASVGKIYKNIGDRVAKDEILAEIETEKVVLEICATSSGFVSDIKFKQGEIVKAGDLIFLLSTEENCAVVEDVKTKNIHVTSTENPRPGENLHNITDDGVTHLDDARVRKVKMSKLRSTIAKRLKDAQNTAAILTTFNEIDMTKVMSLRSEYKEAFEKEHSVKLGFMSFFTKATVIALKEIPAVNAEITGNDIIYKNYYNIGVAVGTENGLVVPVLRDCDAMSFAEIEKTIVDMGKKARDGKLNISDMQGGTFTISNGGVYGSLLSTPIINPPQSGILGLHNIVQRPIALNGQVVIRPMMYVALSYDHRIIDGKEAVTFLIRIKELMEEPSKLMLDL